MLHIKLPIANCQRLELSVPLFYIRGDLEDLRRGSRVPSFNRNAAEGRSPTGDGSRDLYNEHNELDQLKIALILNMPPLMSDWNSEVPQYPGQQVMEGLFVYRVQFDAAGFCKPYNLAALKGNPMADLDLQAAVSSAAREANVDPTADGVFLDVDAGPPCESSKVMVAAFPNKNAQPVAIFQTPASQPATVFQTPAPVNLAPQNITPSPLRDEEPGFIQALSAFKIPPATPLVPLGTPVTMRRRTDDDPRRSSSSAPANIYHGAITVINHAPAASNPLSDANVFRAFLAELLHDQRDIPRALALARQHGLL